MVEVPELYHYTCHCGRQGIGNTGLAKPMRMHSPDAVARCPEEWRWLTELVWFTSQVRPDAVALGLTRETIQCDRTRWRYRVTDATGVRPWKAVARDLPRNAWQLTVGDHRPGLWWVADRPVPVVLDANPRREGHVVG